MVTDKIGRKVTVLHAIGRFRVILGVIFVVLLVSFWPKLLFWFNRPISRADIHGSFIYLEKDFLKSILKPQLKKNFFQLDLNSIRRVLLEQPWVRRVTLRREWPDKLVVVLEENEVVARWYDYQLLTGEGKIFTPLNLKDFNLLPVLKGPVNRAKDVMDQYRAIGLLLRPLGLSVSELELQKTGGWRFYLGGVQVNIGAERMMERLQRFIRLYHAHLEPKWMYVKNIDLRYSNGASVAWNN